MPYQMVKHEWDLTEEEQEQARFIQEWSEQEGQKILRGASIDLNEKGGYMGFKEAFFDSVRRRLLIPFYSSGFSSFSFSDDCKKLVAYKVEKQS